VRLRDERLQEKINRIAVLNACSPDEALEAVVRYGLVYREKIEAETPYRTPEAVPKGVRK
jgi:hypothetical protein